METPKFLKSPWSGAIGWVVLVIWEAFWLVGPPLGVDPTSRHWYLLWGLLALLICGVQAFVALLRENKRLKRKLDEKQRKRKAKELIGRLLEQLAKCEGDAYDGTTKTEYDTLYQQLEDVKREVKTIASKYLDASFESRFIAVNVHNTEPSDAIKMHFVSRAQGSFWTVYQQIKGWRAVLTDILKELGP